jgi:hypothetical protein
VRSLGFGSGVRTRAVQSCARPADSEELFLFLSFWYLAFRCVLQLVLLRPRSTKFKELESLRKQSAYETHIGVEGHHPLPLPITRRSGERRRLPHPSLLATRASRCRLWRAPMTVTPVKIRPPTGPLSQGPCGQRGQQPLGHDRGESV